jgi:uncharacterized protein YcbK (DUF882 family)
MRRTDFLYALTAAAFAGMSPRAIRAATPGATRRVLWLRRAGYGDEIMAPFCIDGRTLYDPGYKLICWLMRDRAIGSAQGYVKIDVVEIEALWEVQQVLALMAIRQPLVITSGYRSPQTNAATEGAARNSMHIYGKAADMYVPGVSTRELFDVCWSREVSGGIGYYDDHVHLDSGTRRWWVGDLQVPERAGVSLVPDAGSNGYGAVAHSASDPAAIALRHGGVLDAQSCAVDRRGSLAPALPADALRRVAVENHRFPPGQTFAPIRVSRVARA